MKLTKALLVVAAGLILATQAQAELIDFGTDVGTGYATTPYVMEELPVTITWEWYDEEDGFTGWYIWDGADASDNPTPAVAQPWSDGYSPDGDGLCSMYFSAPVTVESLWAKVSEGADPVTIVGRLGGSQVWTASVTTGDSWTEDTTGAGQNIDELAISNADPGGIDDMIIIPEPATLALLGLGGLGLLLRRKRR